MAHSPAFAKQLEKQLLRTASGELRLAFKDLEQKTVQTREPDGSTRESTIYVKPDHVTEIDELLNNE